MKKLSIALALGLVFVLALASVASADNGPHGGYNGSTNGCSSCHRAHSAVSTEGMLLVQANIWLLCTSCHDGTGALTNVVNGYYDTSAGDPGKTTWSNMATSEGGWGDAGYGLFGGGFVTARMLTNYGNGSGSEGGLAEPTTNTLAGDLNTRATAWAVTNTYDFNSPTPVNRDVTSRHDVFGATANSYLTTGTGVGVVWGSGNIQVATIGSYWGADQASFNGSTTAKRLECTSCHNPHGNAGEWMGTFADPTTNYGAAYPSYRLLDFTPKSSNGFEPTAATEASTNANAYWPLAATWGAAVGTAGSNQYLGITAAFNTGYVVPTVSGVMVPDPVVTWYTVNNDIAQDNTLEAYRGSSGEEYVAISAGRGDYMARYYGYRRPATGIGDVTYSGRTTQIRCFDGTNMTSVAGDCAGGTGGKAFNNVGSHDTLAYWCATCHDRYLAPGGASRTTDSGDSGYHRRHRAGPSFSTTGLAVNTLGSATAGTYVGSYTCVDCHNAHGTAATADVQSTSATYAGSSVLLKADNRAVCVRCHAPAVNFFNIVTSPTAPMIVAP